MSWEGFGGAGAGVGLSLKVQNAHTYGSHALLSLPRETLCWARGGLFRDLGCSQARQSEMETAFMPSAGEWLTACWRVYCSSKNGAAAMYVLTQKGPQESIALKNRVQDVYTI